MSVFVGMSSIITNEERGVARIDVLKGWQKVKAPNVMSYAHRFDYRLALNIRIRLGQLGGHWQYGNEELDVM